MSVASPVSMFDVTFVIVVTLDIVDVSAGKHTSITAVEIQLMSIPLQIHTSDT